MNLTQVTSAVSGYLIGESVMFDGVTTDSRSSCSGKLFIALEGDNFNAHDFVHQAQEQGASAVMVHQDVDVSLPQVRVDDTQLAFAALAGWHRSRFNIPVIGITGSVGKTSVKEMLANIFALTGPGVVTKGNLNNEIGVPITLMRLDEQAEYAIVEMGMNHAGEISRLTRITQPIIALINNAAAAHLEGLGTVEKVALAKGEIFEGLGKDGIAILNADDNFFGLWRQGLEGQPQISFGLDSSADVSATYDLADDGIKMRVSVFDREFDLALSLMGKHNVMNCLAAIAVSFAAKVPMELIKQGLLNYSPIKGRLNMLPLGGLMVIDDTYNANPASMRAAIEVLSQYPDSTLIVGDMGELGDASITEHRRIGELAQRSGVGELLAVGAFSDQVIQQFKRTAKAFSSQQDLIGYLQSSQMKRDSAILVKGSRSSKMENVVDALLEMYKAGEVNSDESLRGQG